MRIPIEGPSRVSLAVLVAANGVVLWGVLVQDWAVFPILLLFWLENLILGVLNVARMLAARPDDAGGWALKLLMVPFFCVHYGMFTLIHGLFVLMLFGGPVHGQLAGSLDPLGLPAAIPRLVGTLDLWIPVAVLAASHAFSFLWNFILAGEYREVGPRSLMSRPYRRVVALHVTIIAGGGLAMVLGSPLWALLMLLAIKTVMDARAHYREHGPQGRPAGGQIRPAR